MLPATMRAARLVGPGQPLVIENVDVPRAGPGQVVVRVKATGLCGSDVHIAVEGMFPTGFLPITLGHEPAGEVAEVGEGVTGWAPGDRVTVFPVQSCGSCEHCIVGRPQVCPSHRLVGIHLDGGLAEFLVTPASALIALPDTVSFEVGAIIVDAVATPFHALRDRAQLRAGETVAVFGVGGLGLHAIELARFMGAGQLIAVDVRQSQFSRAKQFGADLTIDASSTDPVAAILEATAGHGVDVAAEFVGQQTTITHAVQSLATAGRAVIVGLGSEPLTGPPPTVFVRKEASILASYASTKHTAELLVSLVASRRLDFTRSVTHRFPLEQANDALQVLLTKKGDPLRVVIQPN